MRIISGTCKGRKLSTPKGQHIRPTADRLRETLFNILNPVTGDVVLDLFAGTGALGIEALSRGACLAVFIDHHPAALNLIRRNVEQCGLLAQSRIIAWDIRRNLHCLQNCTPPFDLVFLDPPYERGHIRPALEHMITSGALAAGGRIVIEHSPKEMIETGTGYQLTDQRRHGRTMVSFLRHRCL